MTVSSFLFSSSSTFPCVVSFQCPLTLTFLDLMPQGMEIEGNTLFSRSFSQDKIMVSSVKEKPNQEKLFQGEVYKMKKRVVASKSHTHLKLVSFFSSSSLLLLMNLSFEGFLLSSSLSSFLGITSF